MNREIRLKKEKSIGINERRHIIRGCVSVFVLFVAVMLLPWTVKNVDASKTVESNAIIKSSNTAEKTPTYYKGTSTSNSLADSDVVVGTSVNLSLSNVKVGTSSTVSFPTSTTTNNNVNVQWYRVKDNQYTAISGAQYKTYTISGADIGYQLTAVIYYCGCTCSYYTWTC